MGGSSAPPLTSIEIYQGCRTPSVGSEFSESSSEPIWSPSSSAREAYEGFRTPDWLPPSPSQRSADYEGVADVKSKGISKDGSVRPVAQTFTFRELAAATNNFADDCLMEQRIFGRVYKGRLGSTNQVVIIKQFTDAKEGIQMFLTEVLFQSLLQHPHIVNFIGYCADGYHKLVVHDYMPLGSLEDHLHDLPSGKRHLDWNTRMKIVAGVARGLEYLHDKANPPVIFRALMSANILLGEDYHPKLAYFGSAKPGPVGPEYAMSGQLSLKLDIYNFGVVLLEIITGRKALDIFAAVPSLVVWALPFFKEQERLEQMADPMLQGQYPKEGFHQALNVAARCLEQEPALRPPIADVVASLSLISSESYVLHMQPPQQGSPLAPAAPRQ